MASDTPSDMNKALFTSLVMMLSTSAMQQLGKLVNPMTGKPEFNLEGAQMSIDMLSMLKDKTQGNLDKEEEGLLRNVLASAQMNYVEAARSAPPPAAAPETATPPAPEPPPAAAPGAKHEDPKFHKTYGA